MVDPGAKRLLERAASRGLVGAAVVHETLRRLQSAPPTERDAQAALGILREVASLDERAILALEDRSLEGRTVGGFLVEKRLGQGAMGSVYRATQSSLGRKVALKVLDPALALEASFVERFRREARAAARLDHPHVVQPFDFGEEHGVVYFAMELMEGSAADRLSRGGRYTERETLDIGIAIARALEFASDRGLVHRDVKPDNVLFSRDGTAKLGDLGLVLERTADTQLTEAGVAMGTPDYMAPEQARGRRDLDVRADLYALGVTLFEMVSGTRPFEGEDALAVAIQHIEAPIPDVRERAAEVSAGLAAVIERCMAKSPAGRFPTPRALREALEACRDGRAPPETPPPAPEPPPEAPPPPAPIAVASSRVPIVPLLLLALPIAAMAALIWIPRTGTPDHARVAAAADSLRARLAERQQPAGGFGWQPSAPADAWSTAQALAALSTAPGSTLPVSAARMASALASLGVDDAVERGEGVAFAPADTAACTEVTAWCAIAYAAYAARTEATERTAAIARAGVLARALVRAQAPGGGLPSVPSPLPLPPRASATALGLWALVAVDALGADAEDTSWDAIARAAAALGRSYDPAKHAFPTDMDGGRDTGVAGQSEVCAIALLEAEDALRAAGRALPGEAAAALDDYARAAPTGQPPAWDALGSCDRELYTFTIPAGRRTSLAGMRFVASPWRLHLALRLSRRGDAATRRAWEEEAARLIARAPQAPAALALAPTFVLAETVLALHLSAVERAPSLRAWIAEHATR